MSWWVHHLLWFACFGTLLSDAAKFLSAPFRGAEELVTNVWHAVRALFLKLRDVFGHVWDAFNGFYTAIVAFGRGAIHFATNVVHAIGWLVEQAIPAAATWAWRKAWTFAKAAVAALKSFLLHTLAWLRAHLERLIKLVEKLAQHLYRVLLKSLLKAWHWIHVAGAKVYSLVMHPDRLVTWILPHLIEPLLSYAVRHATPVVRFIFKTAMRDTLALALLIEDVLAKLL